MILNASDHLVHLRTVASGVGLGITGFANRVVQLCEELGQGLGQIGRWRGQGNPGCARWSGDKAAKVETQWL